jgi:hypothetical protein
LGADLAAFHPHALALCAIAGLAGAPQVRIPLGGGGGAGLSPTARPGADRALLALAARLRQRGQGRVASAALRAQLPRAPALREMTPGVVGPAPLDGLSPPRIFLHNHFERGPDMLRGVANQTITGARALKRSGSNPAA